MLDAMNVDQGQDLPERRMRQSERVPIIQCAVMEHAGDLTLGRLPAEDVAQVVANGSAGAGTAQIPDRTYDTADWFGEAAW